MDADPAKSFTTLLLNPLQTHPPNTVASKEPCQSITPYGNNKLISGVPCTHLHLSPRQPSKSNSSPLLSSI